MNKSIILSADSYKTTHWMQLPEGTTYSHSAITPRKSDTFKKVVPFGITAAIRKWLSVPIQHSDIDIAKAIIDAHMGPGIFNEEGWRLVVDRHGGYIPVSIKALPEGTVVPIGTQIVQIESTDLDLAWLPSYLETTLLRDVWYPTTVATLSATIKHDILKPALERTSDNPGAIDFMLHDFGYRGVSSDESGSIGGLAHLINFRGTDTMGALVEGLNLYGASNIGFSVIASEHSTVCANSDADTRSDRDMVEKMVSILEKRVKETGTFQIVSCVADTYDVWRFAKDYVGGEFRERIMNSGGRFVVRPDSGNPVTVPVEVVKILLKQFGCTTNSKGYKVLPDCVRVLQGDGIGMEAIQGIVDLAESYGISAENFVFGMGGGLLQKVDRDTLGFAMKADLNVTNGKEVELFKDPVTDPGKRSLRGIHSVVKVDGQIKNVPGCTWSRNMLKLVYRHDRSLRVGGPVIIYDDWANIVQRVEEEWDNCK